MSKISLVINTKNEEGNIADCIKSAKGVVHEVVVVDMQSKDKTKIVARKNGARVFDVKDYDHVGPAREYAISKAKNEWILLLDADERLSDGLKKQIPKLISRKEVDIVEIPFKTIIFGRWIKHTRWWPDYHPRLFKKSSLEWPGIVQTAPSYHGKVLRLKATENNSIIHYNYKNTSDFVAKMNRYTNHEISLDKTGVDSASYMYDYMSGEFGNRYFANKGYLDGFHGFFLSKLMETYRLLEIIKYWERNGYKDLFDRKQILPETKRRYKSYMSASDNQVEYEKIENELKEIKDSKFYKGWLIYNRIKGKILKLNER